MDQGLGVKWITPGFPADLRRLWVRATLLVFVGAVIGNSHGD